MHMLISLHHPFPEAALTPAGLCDMLKTTDLNAWASEQARLLRERRFDDIDAQGIADEIEDVGKSEQRELASRMAVLLAHLLKWDMQAQRRGSSWQATIRAQRKEIAYALLESPSLKPKLTEPLWVDMVWSNAVAAAMTETGIETFPDACPWSLETQALKEDWWPGA